MGCPNLGKHLGYDTTCLWSTPHLVPRPPDLVVLEAFVSQGVSEALRRPGKELTSADVLSLLSLMHLNPFKSSYIIPSVNASQQPLFARGLKKKKACLEPNGGRVYWPGNEMIMLYESIMDQINVVNPKRKTSNFRGLETTNSWRIVGWSIVVGKIFPRLFSGR